MGIVLVSIDLFVTELWLLIVIWAGVTSDHVSLPSAWSDAVKVPARSEDTPGSGRTLQVVDELCSLDGLAF
jgi:hypothetical protein